MTSDLNRSFTKEDIPNWPRNPWAGIEPSSGKCKIKKIPSLPEQLEWKWVIMPGVPENMKQQELFYILRESGTGSTSFCTKEEKSAIPLPEINPRNACTCALRKLSPNVLCSIIHSSQMLELTHFSPALEWLDQLQSVYTMKLWNSENGQIRPTHKRDESHSLKTEEMKPYLK